jgi:hypothetical protein
MNSVVENLRKQSYVSRSEQPLVIDMMIFRPVVETDKYENPVSKIMYPDFTYNMVHNPIKHYTREAATIYRGRDCFVKFNAYRPESDIAAHTVKILTTIGEFSAWWGDGEGGDLSYPDVLKDDPAIANIVEIARKQMHKLFGHEDDDCEAGFILLVMQIIHFATTSPNPRIHNLWFDKISWNAKKAELEKERLSRRRY